MADVLKKSNLFPETLVSEMMNLVKGKSALAALSASTPIPFNGMKEFTFTLDKEVDVVAEGGAKGKGGATVTPVTIIPVKIEYGARISDEFKYASEDVKLNYLKAFSEGFAKKAARAIDIMAFHGFNPRTATASSVIGDNHFDSKVTQTVTATASTTADEQVESAIALIDGSEGTVTGIAMSSAFRSELAKLKKENGDKLFPELAWGNMPGSINGLKAEVNNTVSFGSSKDKAVIGDFENMFRWGYAKEIPMEIIEYGNPDNDETLGDLKGHNQIYLRCEAYLGWGILDPEAFAIVKGE